MNKKRSRLLLVVVLLLAVAVLSGCANTQGTIDLHKPQGLWNTIVFDVALALQWLNGMIQKINIPFIYNNSWGWAIIIFTLAIKLVTLPLTLKQLQSTKATQELQPKLAELQQKYGKDKQTLQTEQMKLYKEAGVNPLGGCLPLLIQMPILFALYQAMYALANPSVGSLEGARFFWVLNLAFPCTANSTSTAASTAQEIAQNPYVCNGTGWIGEAFKTGNIAMLVSFASLPLIMVLTQLILQKMSTPMPTSSARTSQGDQQKMMGQMMLFMPIFFGYITLSLPSGLSLYWTVSNILSIVQQYFITGWGSLAGWLPMLAPKSEVIVTTTKTTETAPSSPALATEQRPVKRNRRRK
jgi:YidC/Oxa1 family membrane protein insertase